MKQKKVFIHYLYYDLSGLTYFIMLFKQDLNYSSPKNLGFQ